MTRVLWRAPLLALAMLSMVWGVWMGLLRIGWALPLPWPDQLILHGPLMVGGFVGTLIGLERAVGVARRWAYGAPLLTAAGACVLIFGPSVAVGALMMTFGSAVVVAVFAYVIWRQPSWHLMTMTFGAVAWLCGNVLWASGSALHRVVIWWIAFLVLTIAGERLELNRARRPTLTVRTMFGASAAILIAGVLVAGRLPRMGVRLVGLGLLALAGWLAVNDVARRTIGQRGVTRFMAVSLLSGYAWLSIGAVVAIVTAVREPGLTYDAFLHAIFLGFVVSMIFGHAPIVFPAIAGRPLAYRPAFYGHLILLDASIGVRLAGDLIEDLGRLRPWGGVLNACALGLFVINTARSVLMGPSTTSS